MNLEATNRYRCLMFVGASMALLAVGTFIGVSFGGGKAIQSAEQTATGEDTEYKKALGEK